MENDLSLELTKPQMNFLVEVYAFLLDNLFVFTGQPFCFCSTNHCTRDNPIFDRFLLAPLRGCAWVSFGLE